MLLRFFWALPPPSRLELPRLRERLSCTKILGYVVFVKRFRPLAYLLACFLSGGRESGPLAST